MKSTILKLRSTTRKSKELARNFHRILMPLNFCKLGVGNIIIPYLVPASRPRDWTFVSFRKWNKTSGWFIRAVPFSVFIMLSTWEALNRLQIVKAWYVIWSSSDIANFPTVVSEAAAIFLSSTSTARIPNKL